MVDTDDTRRTIHDGRRTTPRVWHKLPTGELIKNNFNNNSCSQSNIAQFLHGAVKLSHIRSRNVTQSRFPDSIDTVKINL